MCRLVGCLSVDEIDAEYQLICAPQSLLYQSRVDPKRRQGDGWGVGWFEGDRPTLIKSPKPIYQDQQYLRRAVRRVGGSASVAHVRWASNPLKLPRRELIGLAHTQPFVHGRWLFVHNGTLFIPEEVKRELGPWRKFVKGKNDSEVLFYWLMKHLHEEQRPSVPLSSFPADVGGESIIDDGSPITASGTTPFTSPRHARHPTMRAIKRSIAGLHHIWETCRKRYPLYKFPYYGLNWVLTDGRMLVAFCYADPRGFGKARALCNRRRPYYQLHMRRTPREIVVASEPLDLSPDWRPMRHGELLIVHRDGARLTMSTYNVVPRSHWRGTHH
jgi:predicted glutamine amidotransferase